MILLMAVMVVVNAGLVADIVFQFTDDKLAAAVSGVAPLAYPPLLRLFVGGPYTKYFVALFGLAALWAVLRDSYVLGAGLATVATVYWQFGIGFLLAVFAAAGVSVTNCDTPPRRLAVMTGVTVMLGLLSILPWIVFGGASQLISQTVVAPLLTNGGGAGLPPLSWFERGWLLLPIIGLGALTFTKSTFRDFSPGRATVLVLFGWFSIAAIYTGQIGRPDMIPAAMLAGIAVGSLIANAPDKLVGAVSGRKVTACVVVCLLTISVSSLLSGDIYIWERGSVASLYWSGEGVTECHIRLSMAEKEWLSIMDLYKESQMCSKWLFE